MGGAGVSAVGSRNGMSAGVGLLVDLLVCLHRPHGLIRRAAAEFCQQFGVAAVPRPYHLGRWCGRQQAEPAQQVRGELTDPRAAERLGEVEVEACLQFEQSSGVVGQVQLVDQRL